jgi:SNF2 family DNA or RNA helicase
VVDGVSYFDENIRQKFEDVIRVRDDLHLYQQLDAIPFLRDTPYSGLFIDMGLGKTISSLTVIVDLLMEFRYDKVLIIGPLRVATETWPTEIGLWEHTAHLNFQVIHLDDDDPRLLEAKRAAEAEMRFLGASPEDVRKAGTRVLAAKREELRREMAFSNASVHIVSRDWVEWLVNAHGPKWPYRMVIVDESSGFKDHNSSRFKALAKVRNSFRDVEQTKPLIERLHILTATPAAETYEHLFAQIYLLDRGERLGKKITHYRDRYFTFDKYKRKYKLRPDGENDILAKIADICLVMKAEDYLNVEKPVIVPRPIHLAAKEMGLYKQLEKEFVVTLDDGTEIEAETAAALSQKLLQIASGVLYETQNFLDDATGDTLKVKKVHAIHDKKIEALRQIVEEAQDQPLMVAYHFKSSLDRLRKVFPEAVVMDRSGKCVKPWNQGKIKMLLIHPQSGGHGLNMQHGGHHLVFFDIPWSLELYLQLIGRLARQGQKHVVIVQLLLAVGTLDYAVYAALCEKEDAQERLFVLLKALIRKARKAKSMRAVAVDQYATEEL